VNKQDYLFEMSAVSSNVH